MAITNKRQRVVIHEMIGPLNELKSS